MYKLEQKVIRKKTLQNPYKSLPLCSGRRGIEPKTGLNPFLKTALNFFCMQNN